MTTAPSTPISGDLPRQFASDDLDQLLATSSLRLKGASAHQGGREAADKALKRVDAKRYAKSRNHLNGAVTGCPPTSATACSRWRVRDAVFQRIRSREEGGKLINELGWRDFWQRMWQNLGDRIEEDQEASKPAMTPPATTGAS